VTAFTQDILEIPEIAALLESESVMHERLVELAETFEFNEAVMDDLKVRLIEADITIEGSEEEDHEAAVDRRALADHQVSGELPSDLTRHFINRASRHKILTREQEVVLAKRIERGDEIAKRQLIENNMKLVIKLAGKYRDQGLEFGDLIQEGVIGLNRAAEKFDWRKGFKFSTYATWWIRQSMQRATQNQGRTVRLPVHVAQQLAKIQKATRRLAVELAREPTDAEIAEATDMEIEEVERVKLAALKPTSLSLPVGEGDSEFGDFLEDEEALTPEEHAVETERQRKVARLLSRLNPDERHVLAERYGLAGGEPRTAEAIARGSGMTAARVREIENAALKRLAHDPDAAALRAA